MPCILFSVFDPLHFVRSGLTCPPVDEGSIEDFMRVLLHNTKTGLFYQGPGEWTNCPEDAFDFKHSRQAINLAFDLGFEDVEIFEDSRPGQPQASTLTPGAA
jgi:hypothetical protein